MGNRSKLVNDHVGAIIKQLRLTRKLTQTAVANHVNKCDSTVRMWELGKSEPDNDTLLILANFFNVSIDYLLGRDDELIKSIGGFAIPQDKFAIPHDKRFEKNFL